MSSRSIFLTLVMLLVIQVNVSAQLNDSAFTLTGIIYDELSFPVPASHVININTHQGTVTDSLGIFRLPVHSDDTLLIRNIAFRDTLLRAGQIFEHRHILIKRKFYVLQEARIFMWGSTYDDFKQAIGESMGLPRQDPDYIPYDMDEEALKSVGFLITSPVSYFYHNFNKYARSARRVYWLKKDQGKYELFNEITGRDNISAVTGLTGIELQAFLVFLYKRLACDFKCTELQLYIEIHGLLKVYQEIQQIEYDH